MIIYAAIHIFSNFVKASTYGYIGPAKFSKNIFEITSHPHHKDSATCTWTDFLILTSTSLRTPPSQSALASIPHSLFLSPADPIHQHNYSTFIHIQSCRLLLQTTAALAAILQTPASRSRPRHHFLTSR